MGRVTIFFRGVRESSVWESAGSSVGRSRLHISNTQGSPVRELNKYVPSRWLTCLIASSLVWRRLGIAEFEVYSTDNALYALCAGEREGVVV